MNLCVEDTTFQEISGGESTFPKAIRSAIKQSLRQIAVEEMEDLLARHESDQTNFDGIFEVHLRHLLSSVVKIRANHPVSATTKFNSDLVIDSDAESVCLEIEKGYLSRFELDILKMLSFADVTQNANDGKPVFGAFVVPGDNVVANHISGNSRESSFKYLLRLGRLVSQIKSVPLQDILVVGYSTCQKSSETVLLEQTPGQSRTKKKSENVLIGKNLLDPGTIKKHLSGYAIALAINFRKGLIATIPKLREKLNCRQRYLGYSSDHQADAVYVYVQKDQLLLDIRVSKEEADALIEMGVRVVPRNNYQSRAGWLTGVYLPSNAGKTQWDAVMNLGLAALSE